MNYARIVLQAIHPIASETIFLTSQQATQSSEYQHFISNLADSISIDSSLDLVEVSTIKRFWAKVRALHDAIDRHHPDIVYVPTADGLIQICGWFRLLTGRAFSGSHRELKMEMLVMRGHAYLNSRRNFRTSAKRWWALTGIRHSGCTTLHALDSDLHDQLAKCKLPRQTLRLMPEARSIYGVPHKSEARERLGLNVDDKIIGFFGPQSKRKGFDLLLTAFAQTTGCNFKLLLMGSGTQSTQALIDDTLRQQGVGDRIIHHPGFTSDDNLVHGMAAADVICLPYPAHEGSSGFLVDAAATGNFILASEFGWIGKTVHEYQLGASCNVRNRQVFTKAMIDSIERSKTFEPGELSSKFLEYNTTANAKNAWTAGITELRIVDHANGSTEPTSTAFSPTHNQKNVVSR